MEVSQNVRTIALLTFALYSIICVVLGNYSARKAANAPGGFGKNYFAAGGNLGWLASGMLIASSLCSGGMFLSNPGLAHSWGLMWPICMATFTFCGLVAAGLINKKLKIICNRIDAVSFGAVLRHRYEDNKFIAWYTPLAMVAFTGLFLYQQMTSGARLMETMTGLPYIYGLVVFGLVLLAYTVFGGSRGTSAVSVFQGAIMTITTVALAVGLIIYIRHDYTTVENAFRNLATSSPEVLSPTSNFGFTMLASYLFLVGFSNNVGKDNVAQCTKIADSKTLHDSTALTLVFVSLWSIIMPTLGTLGRTVFPDIVSDTVVPYSALMVLPPIFAGIVASGVAAAIQSTLAFQMLNVNSCIVMDIYDGLIKKGKSSDAELKKFNTIVTVTVVIITILLAINPPALIGVINNFTIAGGAAAFFMPMLFGVWWPKANKYGCIGAMASGISYYLLATAVPVLAFGVNPIIPSLVISGAAMIILSKLTPEPSAEVQDVWFGVGRTCVKTER